MFSILILSGLLLAGSSLGNIINDDNYIVYSLDTNGQKSYPSRDGYLYTIGSRVSKVDLAERSTDKTVVFQKDQSPLNLAQGAISADGSRLIASSGPYFGGPNCRFFVSFSTDDLRMQEENCLGE